jgi:hypothetical protein
MNAYLCFMNVDTCGDVDGKLVMMHMLFTCLDGLKIDIALTLTRCTTIICMSIHSKGCIQSKPCKCKSVADQVTVTC